MSSDAARAPKPRPLSQQTALQPEHVNLTLTD